MAAWVRLMGAHSAMTRSFNAHLQATAGMTVTDFEVLRRLSDEEGGRMRRVDLAPAVGLTPSSSERRRSTSKSVTVMPAVACRWALKERVMAECAPIRRTQAATARSA